MKREVKERNNEMQLCSFNKPMIPARTKIPRQAVHIISFDKATKSRSKPHQAVYAAIWLNAGVKKKKERKGNQNVANPSDSLNFLGVITNYISIIMVMLGNFQ